MHVYSCKVKHHIARPGPGSGLLLAPSPLQPQSLSLTCQVLPLLQQRAGLLRRPLQLALLVLLAAEGLIQGLLSCAAQCPAPLGLRLGQLGAQRCHLLIPVAMKQRVCGGMCDACEDECEDGCGPWCPRCTLP